MRCWWVRQGCIVSLERARVRPCGLRLVQLSLFSTWPSNALLSLVFPSRLSLSLCIPRPQNHVLGGVGRRPCKEGCPLWLSLPQNSHLVPRYGGAGAATCSANRAGRVSQLQRSRKALPLPCVFPPPSRLRHCLCLAAPQVGRGLRPDLYGDELQPVSDRVAAHVSHPKTEPLPSLSQVNPRRRRRRQHSAPGSSSSAPAPPQQPQVAVVF